LLVLVGYLHAFVLLYPVCGFLWGLMIEAFRSPCIIHLGIGLFSPPRVAHSELCCSFSALSSPQRHGCLTEESRGLYPACVRYHYQDEVESYSSVMTSPVIGLHHFVHEVGCGVLCVCAVSLRGFTIERSRL
jgi:hypothetical protein